MASSIIPGGGSCADQGEGFSHDTHARTLCVHLDVDMDKSNLLGGKVMADSEFYTQIGFCRRKKI